MSKLALMIYLIAAPTLAGVAMVAALTVPGTSTTVMLWAIALGFVAAIPVAFLVAKKITS